MAWGDWIRSAFGEWQQCAENPKAQVKLAQRSLGGDSLLRLQLSVKLPCPARDFFPLPETSRYLCEPLAIFGEMEVLQLLGPGDALVKLKADPEKLWYKVLMANLPETDLQEVQEGRRQVLRGFPEEDCSTQILSCCSRYLSCAMIASPANGKLLLTLLLVVPCDPLSFRLKHLARSSISRLAPCWVTWLFSDTVAEQRESSQCFYVVLSIHCHSAPLVPLPSLGSKAKPLDLSDWQVSVEDSFAGYLRHFCAAAGFGHIEVFSSLDGKLLAPYQAALPREVWAALPQQVFQNASMAYRKYTGAPVTIAESSPDFVDDALHVQAELNLIDLGLC